MQQAFDEVKTWTNDNSTDLNPPKTNKCLHHLPPQLTPIQINGEAVSQVKCTKHLRVTISYRD